MNIRFTAKPVERLCDTVRGMVEEVRSHERKIHGSVREQGAACRARTSSRCSPATKPTCAG